MKKGWICPKCETVYSPEVKECKKCTVKESSESKGKKLLLD